MRRRPNHQLLLIALGLVWAALTMPARAQDALPFRFGPYEATIGELRDPSAVAIDDEGRIYIAQRTGHDVAVHDRTGALLARFGRRGSERGELLGPMGIAVDGGEIFLADTGNDRVQVFDQSGKPLRAWGDSGTGAGQLRRPQAIAVRGERVIVADTINGRVQEFTRDGKHVRTFGWRGDEATPADARLNAPVGVALGANGVTSVTDAADNRVIAFDAMGRSIRKWGDWGPFEGLLDEPRAIVARDERIFIADMRNHRVQVFREDGKAVYQWGQHALNPREGEGKLHYPKGLAVAPDGSFAVVCEEFENRCQVFALAPPEQSERQTATPYKPKPPMTHFGPRLALSGTMLAIPEPETHTVYLFRIDGRVPVLVTQFGMRGSGFGQLMHPQGALLRGLEADAELVDVLLTDAALGRVQWFRLHINPHGELRFAPYVDRLMRAYLLNALPTAQLSSANAWRIAPVQVREADQRMYLVDAGNAAVQVFERDRTNGMSLRATWRAGDGAPLLQPTDLEVDVDAGEVFIVDALAAKVVVLDLDGNPLRSFGAYGDGADAFMSPFGIELLQDGSVLVSDAAAHRLLRFTRTGEFLDAWGEPGYRDGQLWKPGDIEQADDGRIYIADYGNHRAQIFAPAGEWLVRFGLGSPSMRKETE